MASQKGCVLHTRPTVLDIVIKENEERKGANVTRSSCLFHIGKAWRKLNCGQMYGEKEWNLKRGKYSSDYTSRVIIYG
jgi:hypothetical protein